MKWHGFFFLTQGQSVDELQGSLERRNNVEWNCATTEEIRHSEPICFCCRHLHWHALWHCKHGLPARRMEHSGCGLAHVPNPSIPLKEPAGNTWNTCHGINTDLNDFATGIFGKLNANLERKFYFISTRFICFWQRKEIDFTPGASANDIQRLKNRQIYMCEVWWCMYSAGHLTPYNSHFLAKTPITAVDIFPTLMEEISARHKDKCF